MRIKIFEFASSLAVFSVKWTLNFKMTRQWANCISVERVKTPRNGSKFSGALIGRTCSTLVMIHPTYSPIHFDSCSWAGKMSGTKRDIRSRNGPAWLRSDCVAETGLRGQNGVAWPEWNCVARMYKPDNFDWFGEVHEQHERESTNVFNSIMTRLDNAIDRPAAFTLDYEQLFPDETFPDDSSSRNRSKKLTTTVPKSPLLRTRQRFGPTAREKRGLQIKKKRKEAEKDRTVKRRMSFIF